MDTVKKVAKGTLFNFITTLTKWLRAIVISVVVARMLGPSEFGLYTLIIWVILISGMFVNLGFTTTTAKYVSEYKGRDDSAAVVGIIRFVLEIQAVAGIIVTLVIFSASPHIAAIFSESKFGYLFAIAAVGILPSALFDISSYIFTGLQQFKYLAAITFITSFIAVLSIPLALLLGYGVLGLIVINIAINCIGLCLIFYLLGKEIPFAQFNKARIAGEIKRRILRYNIYIIGIVVFDVIVNQRTEIFFLGYFRTAEEVAFYSVAFGVASAAMNILPGSLANVLLPVISETYGKDDREKLKKLFVESTKYLMILAIPICIGGILLASPIISLIYGDRYSPAGPALAVLLVSSCAMVIGTGASSLQYGIERQDIVLKLGIFLAALNITLDFLLIPKMGVIGAVVANSTSQITGVIISQVFTCKLLKTRWPLREFLWIFLASLAMAPFVLIPVLFLGKITGLFLAVCLGSFAYLISTVLFKVIEGKDIALLERLERNVPSAFQGTYVFILRTIKKYV